MHALVTADTIGGVWTYVCELVTGLIRRGVRVTLVSFGEIPDAEQTGWMEGLAGLDFRPTGFRLEWMQEAAEDLDASSEYLLTIIREVKPELLHLNQYCYGSLPVDIPRVVVAHSDVVSWWVNVRGAEPPDTMGSRWYRNVVTRGIAGATALIAPSQFMLAAVKDHFMLPGRSGVIYNGRTPHLFNPFVSKDKDGYIMSVGRIWDGGKQTSLLLHHEPPAPLYLVGPQEHPDRAVAGEWRVHAGNQIHFKGRQSEAQLRQLYSRASIYAATSRYEPFGLAPLEAALSRCAIVANDTPSFREIWGESACYFQRNDADSLQHVLHTLCADPKLAREYANRAYHHALGHYTSGRMVDEYLALYRTLIGAGKAAA